MTPPAVWYALHVRSRAELAVARQIEHKGYEAFVPLYTSLRRWADREKELALPLFPSYVFCRVTVNSTGLVVTTPGVIRIVAAGGVPLPVEDDEIHALQRIVQTRARSEPVLHMQAGTRVEVRAGPLRGLQGVLAQSAHGARLVVSVTLLQRSVAVEIDSRDLVPLGA